MKKKLGYIGVSLLLIAQSLIYIPTYALQDPELDLAVQRMHENNLTKYNTISEYNPEDFLTREQGAKFFVNFTDALELDITKKPNSELTACEFGDQDKMDPTLSDRVSGSCALGLFKGANGFFFPTEVMTKAQAITVLIRALEGPQDETTIPRWKNYHQQARALSLTKENDVMALDKPVTRYEIALLLFRASQDDTKAVSPEENEAQLEELIELLKQLGLQTL